MSAVTRALLALTLLAAASSARAADAKKHVQPAPPRLECPDLRAPILTGHPFRPLSCPEGGKEPSVPAVQISTAMAPLDAKGGDLGALEGSWRGLVYFAGQRTECTLTVTDGGRRGTWEAMDYATHIGHALEVELKKPGWFSRGVPRVEVTMPHLPGAKLSGRVWLAPGVAAWRYDGRPEVHRVQYKISGDHLSATYTDFDPVHGPLSTSVELDKIRP